MDCSNKVYVRNVHEQQKPRSYTADGIIEQLYIIRQCRYLYRTDTAYQRDIEKYRGALTFLLRNGEVGKGEV